MSNKELRTDPEREWLHESISERDACCSHCFCSYDGHTANKDEDKEDERSSTATSSNVNSERDEGEMRVPLRLLALVLSNMFRLVVFASSNYKTKVNIIRKQNTRVPCFCTLIYCQVSGRYPPSLM